MMQSKRKTNIIVLILFLFGSITTTTAQIQPKKYVIAGISVEGNKFSDAQTIISLSGLRAGDQIMIPNDTKINTAIKTLWARKQFSDVKIIIDKITPMGVMLLIKVKEFPRLNVINIRNNDALSDDDIKEAIGIVHGDIISPYEAYKAKKKLKAKYSDEDLGFAKVHTELGTVDSNNFVDLNIDVNEGVEYHVNSINIEGNKFFDDDDITSEFEDTKTKHWYEVWKSSAFDLKKYQEDKKLLLNFYRNNGFRDIEIIKDTVIYNEENENVDIIITINEGQRIYIRNIEFVGNSKYPAELLKSRLDIHKGDPYNLEKLQKNLNGNEDQTDANSIYMNNGFLFSRMTPEEIRIPPDSVDLKIRVTEGDRVTIRKIIIKGNTKTKDKVIRRELFTQPGDYFNRASIVRSVRRLGMLNYFNPEALRPDITVVDNTKVDVIYQVEERSTDTFNASIGYAGYYGLTGSIGFSFNNFSLLEPFRGGAGQILNFTWEFGQSSRYQNFSIGFTEPWLFDQPTTIGFNIYDSKINYGYSLRRTGGSINLGRRFRWPDEFFRGDLNLRVQRNDVQNATSNRYYINGLSTEATIGLTLSRMDLDNLYFPTEGSKFVWTNSFAMGALNIGNIDYFKSTLRMEMNQPLMKIKGINRVMLNIGTYLGFISGIKSDSMITPIELFYMGGNGLGGINVDPLRGYTDQSVGPLYGGRVLAHYYTELRFAITQDPMPVFLYGFAEAGNVWHSLKYADPFNLKRSAGFGVRMLLNPIGIIGFSYGFGFDNDDRTGKVSGWRFLFHFGQ